MARAKRPSSKTEWSALSIRQAGSLIRRSGHVLVLAASSTLLVQGGCTKTSLSALSSDGSAAVGGSERMDAAPGLGYGGTVGGASSAGSGAGGIAAFGGGAGGNSGVGGGAGGIAGFGGGAGGIAGLGGGAGGSAGVGSGTRGGAGGMAGSPLGVGGGTGGRGGGGSPGTGGGLWVSQAALVFGSVDVGQMSPPATANVTNMGNSIQINPTVVGAGFAISGTTCPAILSAGATCTISVVFAPTAAGAASGVLTFGGVSVALSGIGIPPPTFIATDTVALGTVVVGATAPVVVQITPSGSLSNLTCLASGADLFLTSQTCPLTGTVSASCSFTFTFKAASAGVKSDAVVCSGSGSTTQTTVSATVVTPPGLAVSPPSMAFTASVGSSTTAIFNVANIGGSPTGLLTITISSGPDFSIVANDCLVQLSPLATCKVQVAFSPTSPGAKTGKVTVSDSIGTAFATVALTGTAVAGTAADGGTAIVSYAADIVPLLKRSCLCHVQGGQAPLLDTYANVKANAPSAMQVISNGSMPPPPNSLSDADRALLQTWINAGAPNN